MKAIKVPVEGDITLVDIPEHEDHSDLGRALFGYDTIVEHVRFGRLVDNVPTVYTAEDRMVVMLVNEDGHAQGEHINPKATALYRSGVHDGVIVGDAYLVMERRDMMLGDIWSDIEQPYATPDFWMEVVDA
jgi:hypothetical protein